MTTAVITTTTLFAPKVRYTSTFDSQFDAMMTWRAELELAYFDEGDDGDAAQILAGFAEFAIINTGEHPIIDLLDSLSDDALEFADLFDDTDVAPELQDQFDDSPFNRVMIITDVEIAEALRGHGLGAWLVAEAIARMTSPIDTLVLLNPNPAGLAPASAAAASGGDALSRYWQRCGLSAVEHLPRFFCAATAYSHLTKARSTLRNVENCRITVPLSLIRQEPPSEHRDTIMTAPEPAGLRLVRD